MTRKLKNALVTGGCGFIGSNFIRHCFKNSLFEKIVNLDLLTYAGNINNLADINSESYIFEHGDICDRNKVKEIFDNHDIDTVIHFAAESHVDNSIVNPECFIKTNVMGTFTLLDVAKNKWNGRNDVLFHYVNSDEIFGSLGETGQFYETTLYDPRSPYSASKASGGHLVSSYFHTYGLPITMSNCSNNYGPYQFPEKLIPLMILNMLGGKPLPVYGKGANIRDWIYVEDHNEAVCNIITNGIVGECYNIGGENEIKNIDIIYRLIEIVHKITGKSKSELEGLITFVKDRAGHDFRYAINCDKIKTKLGWKCKTNFDEGLEKTVRWYINK